MILVTGGTGLVGSHLLFNLTKAGKKVRAIYRNEDRILLVKKVFAYYTDAIEPLINKIEWVSCDLNDIPNLEIVFNNITQVYHCAALISFDPRNIDALLKTNVEGTTNIVNLCIKNNIEKLCYVSSIATIGNPIIGERAEEETEFNDAIANVYALSKHKAEMEVWRGSQEGVKSIIVNPGLIIGPGFWHNGSGLLFSKIYKGVQFYPPTGTGIVAVNDVVQIMGELMDSPISNERYILVGENLSHKDTFTMVAESLHKKPPKFILKIWMLQLFWRLDWVRSAITGKERVLTKKMALSFNSTIIYTTDKVKKQLAFNFTNIKTSIAFSASIFLKENP